ncbi:MAG: hypothetical protein HY762_05520 [Planctomycetes bacterium]|nr:hypothetical protein [Planctomycetota bacterium]
MPGVVGAENITDDAVTSPKIKDESIRSEDIGAGQVQEPDIVAGAITTDKLAAGAVTTDKIKDSAVTKPKLAGNSVGSPEIIDGSVTTPKIVNGAVTAEKLGSDVVIGALGNGAVTTDKIADGAVTEPKLADNSVNAAKIMAGAVGSSELATNSVITSKIADGAVTPAKLSTIDAPADGETPTYNAAQAKFEWKPAAGVSRPLVPPITTAEIGDAQVTPAKLSFTPVSRPLVPPATPAEMEDRFTIAQNLLLFSNLSSASVPNTEIDLSPYVPVGTKYAMMVMTHAGASTILYGYKAQFYTKPTVDPAPLYRLDTAAKDFTNYLTVLVPLDSARKFLTSVYRDGVTTAAELYLMGYIR